MRKYVCRFGPSFFAAVGAVSMVLCALSFAGPSLGDTNPDPRPNCSGCAGDADVGKQCASTKDATTCPGSNNPDCDTACKCYKSGVAPDFVYVCLDK